MTSYATTADGVTPPLLQRFFAGWPTHPTPEQHLRALQGSTHVVIAWQGDAVVGLVTAISDGVLAAYLPLLEVRAEAQGQGIGSELVRRVLAELGPLYMVDVVCDTDVLPFYERLGLTRWTAAIRRDRAALGGGAGSTGDPGRG